MLDKKKNLVDETYTSSILDRIIYRHVLIEIEKERTVEGKGGKGGKDGTVPCSLNSSRAK